MEYLLVLYIYAGALSSGDSVALSTVGAFSAEQECESAGNSAVRELSGGFKSAKFTCLPRTKQ